MQLRPVAASLMTVLLLTSTLPAGAIDLRAPGQPSGEQLRQNLYRLIDHYQALVGDYPSFQPLLETLAETRQSLDKVPMSQFDALAPKMASLPLLPDTAGRDAGRFKRLVTTAGSR